jgi:hypothetical protein
VIVGLFFIVSLCFDYYYSKDYGYLLGTDENGGPYGNPSDRVLFSVSVLGALLLPVYGLVSAIYVAIRWGVRKLNAGSG